MSETVRAWRIVREEHRRRAFDGTGSARFGGRWNGPGTSVVYAAGAASLAVLEMLVHLDPAHLLLDYRLFEITFDRRLVESPRALPDGWANDPSPPVAAAVGDAWVAQGSSAVLEVPSAVLSVEMNYLLNPAHPDFAQIAVSPPRHFRFDPRLAVGGRTS